MGATSSPGLPRWREVRHFFEHARIGTDILLAVTVVAVATAVRLLLDPLLLERVPFATFFPAVAAAVLWGGYRAGVFSVVLALVCANWLFVAPRGSLVPTSTGELVSSLIFLMASSAIILLGGGFRKARAKLLNLLQESDLRQQELQRALEDRQRAEMENSRLKDRLASDLADMVRLHDVAISLVRQKDSEHLLEEILDAAIELTHSDKGLLQLVDGSGTQLCLAAQRGFPPELCETLRVVCRGTGACGMALQENRRVVVKDIRESPLFVGLRDQLLAADIVAVQATPLAGRDGAILGVLSTHFRSPTLLTDRQLRLLDLLALQAADCITNLRQREELERQVAHRTARLTELVGELEGFSYTVAHDLRAPLRAMRGFARALLEDHAGQLDATGVDYLHRVVQGAARLDRQIEDVLTYSRMVKTELPLDRVDVQRLLRNMLDTNPALQTFRDQIVLELPLPAVTGNPAALTQVFANLLSNAVKFVAPDRPPQVRVSAEWRDDRVRFWVSDNGIGIPAHARTKLFRLFQQLHAADHYDGTGVGLAIVRKAAERMGGTVGVESEENVGSRFWVELSPAPPVSAPEPSAQILPPVSTLAAPILKPFPPASPATAP